MKPPFTYHPCPQKFYPGLSSHADGWYITDADGVVIFSQYEPPPLDLAREICARLEDRERAKASHRNLERAWHETLGERDMARLELAIEKRLLRREEISRRELENKKHALLCEAEALRKTCEEAGRSIDIGWFALSRERNAFHNEQRALSNKRKAKAREWAQLVMLTAGLRLASVAINISKGEVAMACGLALTGIFGVYGCAQARKSFLP